MKKNFIKTISMICLVCILTFATLSACKDDTDDDFFDVICFKDSLGKIYEEPYFAERVDNLEELTSLCKKAGMSINDKSDWHYDSEVYKKFRSYDSKFFKNKSLIVVSIHQGNPHSLEFAKLTIYNDVLTISLLSNYNPYETGVAYPDEVDPRLFLIEISKDSIKDVNQIKVITYYDLGETTPLRPRNN